MKADLEPRISNGAQYIYPRESNRVMREVIEAKGSEIVAERYVSLNAEQVN